MPLFWDWNPYKMTFRLNAFTGLFFNLMLFSGCYVADFPRPASTLDSNSSITWEGLAPYQFPSCKLDDNSISCTFLNYNFSNLIISRKGRKTIEASEKDNPKNKISINFYQILDQDGNYTINGNNDHNLGEVYVTMEGDKFSNQSIFNYCYEGVLNLKVTPTGYDLAICNSKFKYELNSLKYDGLLSLHFLVTK